MLYLLMGENFHVCRRLMPGEKQQYAFYPEGIGQEFQCAAKRMLVRWKKKERQTGDRKNGQNTFEQQESWAWE